MTTYPQTPHLVLETQIFAGRYQVRFNGPPGKYSVFASSDFSSWDLLGAVTNVSAGAVFNDLTISSADRRFYRVQLTL